MPTSAVAILQPKRINMDDVLKSVQKLWRMLCPRLCEPPHQPWNCPVSELLVL